MAEKDVPQVSHDVTLPVPTAVAMVSAAAPKVVVRQYFAILHLWAARHYADEAQRRETTLVDAGHTAIDSLHRAHVISSVFASVSFLEAYINELFQDASHHQSKESDLPTRLAGLTAGTIERLAEKWDEDIWPKSTGDDSYRLQSKYQSALKCAGKQRYDEQNDPLFRDITSLIQLRNRLVHFTPESIDVDARNHDMENRLSEKFDSSPFGGTPWYLTGCLGAGLAHWSSDLVSEFVKGWIARMGLERNLDEELGWVPPPPMVPVG